MLYVLLGVLGGGCTPVQTAVNSRLRKAVGSPLKASMVSFAVGSLALLAVVLVLGPYPMVSAGVWDGPWWIWIPGLFGVYFLTGNVVAMPHLGSLQTVAMPVIGQILAGLAIDAFGWFGSARHPLTILRVIGALLVAAGFLLAVVLANRDDGAKRRADAASRANRSAAVVWLWRLFAVSMGISSAVQTAILGRLGLALGSPIKASLVSFLLGFLAMVLVVGCVNRDYDLRGALGAGQPRWMWLGGLLGAMVVLTNAALAPRLGTGLTVVVVLIGQVAGGVLIDHFGWLEVPRRPVNMLKVIGLIVAFAGVAMIRLV